MLVRLARSRQPQGHCQVGEVADQGGGPLGTDPPDGIEPDAVPVGVLDRQRGLAHPTGTLQRLGDRGRCPPPELGGEVGQGLLPAGQVRVAPVGHVPHRRQRRREPRPLQVGDDRRRAPAGKLSVIRRHSAAAHGRGQLLAQPRAGAGLVEADQVDVDHRAQQALRLARLHPH